MGISRWTALVIQDEGNDIRCEVFGQPSEDGKFAGAVNQYHGGYLHTTLLSSKPMYNSAEQAVVAMEQVVTEIRAIDALA